MKSVALIAGLATSLAAAHAGHGHAHAHDRRGADGVVTSWDVTTEWTYVTVTAGHEQPAPSDNSHTDAPAANSPNVPAQAPASAPASAPAAKASNSEVEAAAVTSAPASKATGQDAAIASVNSLNAHQEQVNSAQGALNSWAAEHPGQPIPASITAISGGGSQPTSAAVASSSAAAPVVPASSVSSAAAAPSASSGGSTSAGGSNCKTTQLSYYGGGGALGSCGWPVYDSNNTVAMPPGLVKCGQKIKIQVHGPNPVPNDPSWHEAIVTDTCPGCTDGHVDGAQDWAQKIAPGIVTPGKADITYCWED